MEITKKTIFGQKLKIYLDKRMLKIVARAISSFPWAITGAAWAYG